jgi:hypothetical protein
MHACITHQRSILAQGVFKNINSPKSHSSFALMIHNIECNKTRELRIYSPKVEIKEKHTVIETNILKPMLVTLDTATRYVSERE